MSERTYRAVKYGPNDWGVSTFIDCRFSQTRSGITEAETKGMSMRYNTSIRATSPHCEQNSRIPRGRVWVLIRSVFVTPQSD